MNNPLAKMSRRERLYVIICIGVLALAFIVYPALKASANHRAKRVEELQEAQELLADYQSLEGSEKLFRKQNKKLNKELDSTDGLLFESVGNQVMTEAMMVKLLNQFGPDLDLDVSISRSSLSDAPGQFNFSVKGMGRYSEILNFIYQVETHRPLIVVDGFDLGIQKKRQRGRGGFRRPGAASQAASTEPTEPNMRLKMDLHIHCREAEEGS